MIALPHLQALRLSGSDALEFAQSQLSADVAAAPTARWHAAAWCDAKGRCLTVLLFNVHGSDHVDLVLPAAQAEDIAGRLKLYMLRRDVALERRPHVAGGGGAPLHFDPQRQLDTPDTPVENDPAQTSAWQRADLDAGMPWLDQRTAGRHLPQSLGLEALGAVEYEKGCYPGQEVIARVHFRGRPPRRLSRIHIQAETPPAPGTPIEDASGNNIGEMLWAVAGVPVQGLAVVARKVTPSLKIKVAGMSGLLIPASA